MRAGTISSSMRFKGHLQVSLGDGHYGQRWKLMMATKTSNRGFASMDEEKQREISRKGGESVPDEKRCFPRIVRLRPKPAAKAVIRQAQFLPRTPNAPGKLVVRAAKRRIGGDRKGRK